MKQIGKLFLTTLVASIVLYGADNALGTWKLNMDKSKFDPAPIVKSLNVTREAADDQVKVTTTGEQVSGTPINASYTVKYDGKEVPVSGAPYDATAIKQVNANTFTAVQKKNGKVYANVRMVISQDGKTMTTTSTGTNAEGKKFHNVMVFDKQ